jgi:recombination directionality factor gp3-like protein
MAILDLQRRIQESGRIRIGHQVPAGKGTRPAKLETFRLTSPNRTLIDAAAQLYGGTPQPWELAPTGNQWEVITTTDRLPVIVPPTDMAFSQWYEQWSAAGCQRRCDGANETISDGPCICDPEARDCVIHTRLAVMLADLAGVGLWRLESQGWNAGIELQGAVDVIRMAARRGELLPATLRLEQRMTKRPGQGTRRFAVPVLDIDVTPAQLLGGKGLEPARQIESVVAGGGLDTGKSVDGSTPPPPALTPVPHDDTPPPSVAEQAASTKPSRRRSTTPAVPKTGIKPRTTQEASGRGGGNDARDGAEPSSGSDALSPSRDQDPIHEAPPPPLDDTPDEPITAAQLTKLSILLKEAGFDDRESRHAFVQTAIGHPITSAKNLTKQEAHKLIDILENDAPGEDPA